MKLTKREIDRKLAHVPGWELSGDGRRIELNLFFRSFKDAMAMVGRVAQLAEEENHHPDIDVRYTRVKFSLTTHDEGALTERDFRMAKGINGLLAG